MPLICILFFSFNKPQTDSFPDPEIKQGVVRVSGKVIHKASGEQPVHSFSFGFMSPISGELEGGGTGTDKDGTFSFEIPVECSHNLISLWTDVPGVNFINLVMLEPGKETILEIEYGETELPKVGIVSDYGIRYEEGKGILEDIGNMIEYMDLESYYQYNPKDFVPFALKMLDDRLRIAENNIFSSERAKLYITNEFRLMFLKGCLLTYTDYISLNYRNFKSPEEPADFTPQEPDIHYYSFLKKFDLNNPQYLYNTAYSQVLQTILSNKTFNIPLIGDEPIEHWLEKVKTTLADLIGSDHGLFYELLAANAYCRQFNNEQKPLSQKQKENISTYFRNKEIPKILFSKNEEIVRFDQATSPTIVNETPAVDKEKLMESIVANYQGKAVVVDFWATWCSPCISAIQDSRRIKEELKEKGLSDEVKFVYLTTTSSPQNEWREKIEGIRGEHYYLTNEEWGYIMKEFDFNSIPSYLFYDRQGVLKNKHVSYPGILRMRELIEDVL